MTKLEILIVRTSTLIQHREHCREQYAGMDGLGPVDDALTALIDINLAELREMVRGETAGVSILRA